MQSLKVSILNELGRGYSVNTICTRLGITYNELCKEAEDLEVYNSLKRWFPLYDFKAKEEVKEVKQEPKEEPVIVEEVVEQAEELVEEPKPLETKEKPVKKKRNTKKKVV